MMALAHSKLTAQGQISVPATIRRKLGIGPGSVRSLFATPPEPRTLAELKEGVRRDIKRRRASR